LTQTTQGMNKAESVLVGVVLFSFLGYFVWAGLDIASKTLDFFSIGLSVNIILACIVLAFEFYQDTRPQKQTTISSLIKLKPSYDKIEVTLLCLYFICMALLFFGLIIPPSNPFSLNSAIIATLTNISNLANILTFPILFIFIFYRDRRRSKTQRQFNALFNNSRLQN
jgi:hypothetical protein